MSGAPIMTENGYFFNEVASALQKEIRRAREETATSVKTSVKTKRIRRAREETALFWALELYGTAPNYCWKRLAIIASEDIGMADPHAAVLVQALWASHDRIRAIQKKGMPVEGDLLAHAVLYLCRTGKNRLVDEYKNAILKDIAEGWRPQVPSYAKDVHTGARGETEADWWVRETAAITPRVQVSEDEKYHARATRHVTPVKLAPRGQGRLFEVGSQNEPPDEKQAD